MIERAMRVIVFLLAGIATGIGISCADRNVEEQCYFVDDASDFSGSPLYGEWCEYELGEVTPLIEEHCPAGECVDYFITCDDVPLEYECQTCPSEDLDMKVMAALEAEYEERCPDGPRELIDFERGCTYEKDVVGSDSTKRCCYTAIVVGECSLMGT